MLPLRTLYHLSMSNKGLGHRICYLYHSVFLFFLSLLLQIHCQDYKKKNKKKNCRYLLDLNGNTMRYRFSVGTYNQQQKFPLDAEMFITVIQNQYWDKTAPVKCWHHHSAHPWSYIGKVRPFKKVKRLVLISKCWLLTFSVEMIK